MLYILIDESGDLGTNYKNGASRHFLMTAVCTRNKRRLEKIVKTVAADVRRKRRSGVLHAQEESDVIRHRIGREFADTDDAVFVEELRKDKVDVMRYADKRGCYLGMLFSLLAEISKHMRATDEIVVCLVSRWDTNNDFNRRLSAGLKAALEDSFGRNASFQVATHEQEKGLQAADYVSWAVFRKLEHSDKSYYDQISPRICKISRFGG